MRVVVPFAVESPKTRLSDVLDERERATLARTMLEDVLEALHAAGRDPEVLATAPVDVDAAVTVDDRALSPAVNAVLAETEGPVAVVMADLALATPGALRRLFRAPGDVVLVPGRGGGTNAVVSSHPDFRVDYHGTSYTDHLGAAHEVGASVYELDSHRLSTDVDEREDLVELLLHGEGRTRDWLLDAGFEFAVTGGRVGVERS